MSCKWKSPVGRQCTLETGHTGNHLTPVADPRCGSVPSHGNRCSLTPGHLSGHEAYEDGRIVATWPLSTAALEGCEHGAINGPCCDTVRDRGAGLPLEICGDNPSPGSVHPPCGQLDGHDGACVSGTDDTANVLVMLSERITELEGRLVEAATTGGSERRLLTARLNAFEEIQQRRTDDLRDAAAAAGEALERTKGLQVPEILRRLNGVERRINSMDGGRVSPAPVHVLDTGSEGRLVTVVMELTAVMRELVRQNARPEPAPVAPAVCGNESYGSVCELAPGHDGPHERGIFSWLNGHEPSPGATGRTTLRTVCGVTRRLLGKYPCVREQGHTDVHRDADGDTWLSSDHEPRTCPAVLRLSHSEFACTAPAGHTGGHLDDQGDRWQVVDRP